MPITKIYKDGSCEVIRIPDEYCFDENTELYLNKVGNSLIITPINKIEKNYYQRISTITCDFMSNDKGSSKQ